MPKVERVEEPRGRKAMNLTETYTQKKFLCKSDLKKQVKNEQFFQSDCKDQIPHQTPNPANTCCSPSGLEDDFNATISCL